MADRIERLVRSREELVQAVSHELGSPLSFHLELLENFSEEERAQRFAAMTRELDSLDQLVAELLGYVQSDETVLARQTFDPSQVLRDLAELAQLEAPEDTGIDVAVRVEPDVQVNADPRLFQRSVENVLRNAIRYGERQVRLELTRGQDHVRIDVHDDGPGISEALRDKVVTPFFRQARPRPSGRGVGLGLAIVSRILQRHGGVAGDRRLLVGRCARLNDLAHVTALQPRALNDSGDLSGKDCAQCLRGVVVVAFKNFLKLLNRHRGTRDVAEILRQRREFRTFGSSLVLQMLKL